MENKNKKNKLKPSAKILLHLLIWIALFFIVILNEDNNFSKTFNKLNIIHFASSFIGFIAISYFNLYILIPRWFKQKEYIKYTAILIFCIICNSLILTALCEALHFLLDSDFLNQHDTHILYFTGHMMFASTGFVILTSVVYFVEEFIKNQNIQMKLKEIENQKNKAELDILKSQINPHFLFNTLNNLYLLSLEKSDKAPDIILKLSDLMSYILYDCKADKVNIGNEIAFIENYISLEKERFGEQIYIELIINQVDSSIKIVPLLFVPLVENAFKHGGNSGNNPIRIKINIKADTENISFKIANTYYKSSDDKPANQGGLGLDNVRKRVELSYPNSQSFIVTTTNNFFVVELNLYNNGC